LKEVKNLQDLWIRGGFPRSFLAKDTLLSMRWRKAYIKTFLERDLANLGVRISPTRLERFWLMLAYYHGQIINYSELGNSLQLSHNTIRHYVDLLSETFMIRILRPWHENISKRQVKAPKVYVRDSGIFHTLLDLDSRNKLERHPKLGASWEGFALEEILRMSLDPSVTNFFWRTHAGAELDLLLSKGCNRVGFEFKFSDAPKITRSMQESIESLKLKSLFIMIPGKAHFQLTEKIYCFGLEKFVDTQSISNLLA
jgi:predicted AAA+ superfamily ATPase